MKPATFLAFAWAAAFPLFGAEVIPARTVVLTFDDAVKSHRTFVAPLLRELGMQATFFVTHRWAADQTNFMSWEDIGELHAMGFEIGNHSWTHDDFSMPRNAARLAGETALVDYELARITARVPRPISFAFSGNSFGPEAVRRLGELGYRFARRGGMPEARYNTPDLGPAYGPRKHHPLLIPTTGDAYPFWDLEHFKKVVALALEGQAVILQFHGVPDGRHPFVSTPSGRFREYLGYLKTNGYRVVAVRDLEPYVDWSNLPDDPTMKIRQPVRPDEMLRLAVEVEASRAEPRYWLENMLIHHRYSWAEVASVFDWKPEEARTKAAEFSLAPSISGDVQVRVLPYPGGRHPRIGFLDGAIDPQRGTKVSVFPPWKDGGYMVLDLPEAIFSNLGLTYLAHTHIPTVWNLQNVTITNVDWSREPSGALRSAWTLPNGISFGAQVSPRSNGADCELWLMNGTTAKLAGLRTQICLMLRGAPNFDAQSQAGKEYAQPLAIAKASDGNKYVMIGFERCGRAWGNPPCPCIHSDPVLPDAEPGQRVAVRGMLRFYEGTDVAREKERLLAELNSSPRP